MAERKRPRRTRERILETGLLLFNRDGEPHVTTANIADEMNISPGNLHYHFRNKDEIIALLYDAFEARVLPLLAAPPDRAANVEDLWLLFHLLFEHMWEYRFLYRDLDDLMSRSRRVGTGFAALIRSAEATIGELCRGMVAGGTMRASEREIAAIARNAILVATYWMSYRRAVHSPGDPPANVPDLNRAAYQVLALLAPYLTYPARRLLERLSADYL
jgi:AcrR family transcriptional regulator